MAKRPRNDMRQKLHLIIFITIAAILMVGCKGKDSQSLSDIPEATVRTHADSLALAARFTGDFKHFLAVTDSLADAGELSQIRAGANLVIILNSQRNYDSAMRITLRLINKLKQVRCQTTSTPQAVTAYRYHPSDD